MPHRPGDSIGGMPTFLCLGGALVDGGRDHAGVAVAFLQRLILKLTWSMGTAYTAFMLRITWSKMHDGATSTLAFNCWAKLTAT